MEIDGEVLAEMAVALPETPPGPDLWARIDAAAEPTTPFDWSRTVNVALGGGEWREIAPGVRRKRLWSDDAFLVSCDPAATIAPHAHGAYEHCVMIQGDLLVGGRKFAAGDYHGVPAGMAHPPLSSSQGAVFLIYRAQAA